MLTAPIGLLQLVPLPPLPTLWERNKAAVIADLSLLEPSQTRLATKPFSVRVGDGSRDLRYSPLQYLKSLVNGDPKIVESPYKDP